MATVVTERDRSIRGDDGTYVLSHDSTEQDRLEQQSYAIWKAMGNRHIIAPLARNASLLVDVGCGSGSVTKSLARGYPGAKVIGVDLAPVLGTVQDRHPNLEYVQGNILDLVGQDPRLKPNTADLVFSRLLVGGLKGGKWPEYVRTAASLLKPGGHLNLVDLAMHAYGCTDPRRPVQTKVPKQIEILELLRAAGSSHGFDFECGMHLEQYMKDAGLVDVQVQEFPWPMGQWLGEHRPELVGFNFEGQGAQLAVPLSHLFKGDVPDEVVERRRQTLEDLIEGGEGVFMILYAVTGRKPE